MTRIFTALVPLCIAAVLIGCGNNEPTPVSPPASGEPTAALTATSADLALEVEGMHCQNCANSLAKVWAKLDGVTDCRVSFAEKRGYLKLASDADADAVLVAIESDLEPPFDVAIVADDAAPTAADTAAPADASPHATH